MAVAIAAAVPLWGVIYRIEAVAGGTHALEGIPATTAQLGNIQGLAFDARGNLYLSDTDHHRVRRVGTDGLITTVAGTGSPGFSGDGGPAASASLNLPYGLAVDPSGALYIADLGNGRVRRVSPDGRISTVASGLAAPRNLAADRAGNLYISEFEGHRIRRLGADGVLSLIAGTGSPGYSGDGGPPLAASLAYPAGLAVDAGGTIYVADSQNHRVRRIVPGNQIGTVVGGTSGTQLYTPLGVAVDGFGTVFVADSSAAVRAHSQITGAWVTIAGTGRPGFNGDGPSLGAQITAARDLALSPSGALYLADGPRVRRINGGALQTVAGDGYLSALGDGGPARDAILLDPSGVTIDPLGRLYIADTGTGRIRRVAGGTISTMAGTLRSPMGVAVDPLGNVTVADTGNDRILQVQEDGRAGVLVGAGLLGPRGVCFDRTGGVYVLDTGNGRVYRNGAAIAGSFDRPSACAADDAGNLYIADTGANRVRVVRPSGVVETLHTGPLNAPSGIAVSGRGEVFVSDTGNHRILRVADGFVETIAGDGFAGSRGDDGPAVAARLHSPGGLWLDGSGNLWVADTGNQRIRKLVYVAAAPTVTVVNSASGRPGPVAPGELVTISGDGIGPAAEVRFDGASAPVFYAQDGLLRTQAPYVVAAAAAVHIDVYTGGRLVGITDVPAAAASPALFPVAYNQDGSVNSEQSPAARGSIVTFFGAGSGFEDGPNLTGQKATPPYPKPLLPVSLSIAGVPAELLYSGAAPELIAHLQINARVPGGLIPPGLAAVELQVGPFAAPPFAIWLQ